MVAVSSGKDSIQNYRTPANFMEACARRFGPIGFDLAAEPHNTQCARYFGPSEFVKQGTLEELGLSVDTALQTRGITFVRRDKKTGMRIYQVRTPNVDPDAVALDSLKQDWHKILAPDIPVRPLLFLNPPFADIAPWAAKCAAEARLGAEILFLVPASVGSEWFAEHVWKHACVYLLRGRLCFDGKDPYPKDCLAAHYFLHPPRQRGRIFSGPPPAHFEGLITVWDWRTG